MIKNKLNINNWKFSSGLAFLKLIATTLIIFHHYQQVTGFRFKSFINFYGGGYTLDILKNCILL